MENSHTRKEWETVITVVVNLLDKNRVRYHIDASLSLYVQGVEFEMEDLDITVEWGALEIVRDLLSADIPTPISTSYPPGFRVQVSSCEVHFLSYQSSTGIGADEDRLKIAMGNIDVWCKTIEFYQNHMSEDHRLWGPLNAFLGDGCNSSS